MAYALSPEFENAGPQLLIPLFCLGLFVCCMGLHGEMAALKPSPRFLTQFYLVVSAGGALGGLFVAVVAPRLFRGFYELPMTLGLCGIFFLLALFREPRSSPRRVSQPLLLGLTGAALCLIGFLVYVTVLQNRQALVMVRNFYGVLRVNDVPSNGIRPAMKQLRNGAIIHGAEILDAARRRDATTYYGPQSGAGVALTLARQRGTIRVGVIGLGAGTLASYARTGDHYSFYEINPLVSDLAGAQFDFIRSSPAQIDIVPGDARLSLERQEPQNFDVLVVDAFSGDAIPIHLLTEEAFALYFRHLKPQGVLAVHVSNRFLDLPPVVEASARALGARAVRMDGPEDQANAIFTATWMLVDRAGLSNGKSTEAAERRVPVWTDDYSNLLTILK